MINVSRRLASRAVTLLIPALLLASCSSSELGAGKLENYISRLSNASGVPVSDVAFPNTASPNKRSIRVAKPPAVTLPPSSENVDTLSIIDFLALSGCELQANIAKRNTTIGRSASASQQLIFDLEFIRLAPACINKLRVEDEGAIADLLEINLLERSDRLVYTIAQAILGGEEWRAFWRTPESLGDYPTSASGDSAQTVWELSERIKRFLDGNWSPTDEDLEPLLAKLRIDAGGQLLSAAMLQNKRLSQANQILTKASEAGKYCSGKRQSEAGTISKTIVAKFFAGDVQKWSSAVSKRHYEIQTPVAEIEQNLNAALSAPYKAWAKTRDSHLDALFSAPRQHVSIVQSALDNC